MKISAVDMARISEVPIKEVLLEVTATYVYVLSRGRNAWHSTWVRHYQGETALYTDELTAKRGAEPLRTPGNVFYVIQAPAVELRGVEVAIVLVDFHPEVPFANYRLSKGRPAPTHVLSPGTPLIRALHSFRHTSSYWIGGQPSEYSLRSGMLDTRVPMPALAYESLHKWTSYAQGVNYYLGWRPSKSPFERRGVYRLVRGFRQRAREIPGYWDLLGVPDLGEDDSARGLSRRSLVSTNDRALAGELAAETQLM